VVRADKIKPLFTPATMETLKQFRDKHVSMDTNGQQYNTTIYNINFELGHTTVLPESNLLLTSS
jgi:hypothetical protein